MAIRFYVDCNCSTCEAEAEDCDKLNLAWVIKCVLGNLGLLILSYFSNNNNKKKKS